MLFQRCDREEQSVLFGANEKLNPRRSAVSKINWSRLLLGGVIATIICFLTDGLLHELILGEDWKAVYSRLHATLPEEHASHMVYFVIFELGRGFLMVFIYVLMRGRFAPGPMTAVLAGVIGWWAYCLTGPAQFIPLGFFSTELWLKAGALQLVASVIAAVAGAAVYKDRAWAIN
jgi:hypothetical protein